MGRKGLKESKHRAIREEWYYHSEDEDAFPATAKCPVQLKRLIELVPQYADDIKDTFIEYFKKSMEWQFVNADILMDFENKNTEIQLYVICDRFDDSTRISVEYALGDGGFQKYIEDEWDDFVQAKEKDIEWYLWAWFAEQD